MTIQELRADSAKLDTDIDFQRRVNYKQRQLNSALDPVARLPLELSSDIFLRSLPAYPIPGDPDVPILQLNICNAWTDIAISTSSLWAAMHILFPSCIGSTQSLKTLVPLWLQRAHNRSLSIALSGADIDYDVVSIIWSHAQQLKHLDIIDVDSDDDDVDWTTIPLWKDTIPGPWMSLETLSISGLQLSPRHILDLLRLAPNLIEFNVEPDFGVDGEEILVLPKLRRLRLETRGRSPSFNCVILEHLSLPGLESLTAFDMYDNLPSFLRRSSPPLRELVLGAECNSPLLGWLQLVPDLRRLELWYPPAEAIFEGLAESPTLIPHINTLVLHVHDEDIFVLFWEALHRALLVRRAGCLFVCITVFEKLFDYQMPSRDIIAAFRAWAMNGVQIQLRTRDDVGVLGRRGRREPWSHTFA